MKNFLQAVGFTVIVLAVVIVFMGISTLLDTQISSQGQIGIATSTSRQ